MKTSYHTFYDFSIGYETQGVREGVVEGLKSEDPACISSLIIILWLFSFIDSRPWAIQK